MVPTHIGVDLNRGCKYRAQLPYGSFFLQRKKAKAGDSATSFVILQVHKQRSDIKNFHKHPSIFVPPKEPTPSCGCSPAQGSALLLLWQAFSFRDVDRCGGQQG